VTVSATDADIGQNGAVTSSLANLTSTFSVDAQTGEVTLIATLDRETVSSYDIYVVATDQGSPTSSVTSAPIRVTVIDINDNPPFFANPSVSFSVSEDATIGTGIGGVLATSADIGPNAVISYAIVGGNVNTSFAINSSTGAISVNGALDREALASFTLTIQASKGSDPVIFALALVSSPFSMSTTRHRFSTPTPHRLCPTSTLPRTSR
jgi:protocadherin Fat 1/2/3